MCTKFYEKPPKEKFCLVYIGEGVRGGAVGSRHCATTRMVAGSILDGVIDVILPGRTVVLGLTQPLTEMSTRNISWGVKTAGA